MKRPVCCPVRRLLAAWLLAFLVFGCARKTPPVVPAPSTGAAATAAPSTTAVPQPARPPVVAAPIAALQTSPAAAHDECVQQLQAELDGLFKAPAFDRMMWSIEVQSLATGEMLYQWNATKLMMPASNMKIVTLAAAAERLGWDFAFETKVYANGTVDHGVLHGDLVVVGGGDPTINGRTGKGTAVFEDWAARVRSAGITSIDGRVVADDRLFDSVALGAGWSWDDLVHDYAAPVTALQYNENVAEVVVRPGAGQGLPAAVTVRPEGSGLAVVNHVTTSATGVPASIEAQRMAGSDRLDLTGTIPLGSPEVVRAVAVDDPARFFAQALKAVLVRANIPVKGQAVSARTLESAPDVTGFPPLLVRRSAPLSEIAKVLMKVSQNLYAETLVKTLGLQGGAGTADAGEKAIEGVLDAWGVAPDSHVLLDGSGLSRYNYVTAEMLVRILRHLYLDPRHRQPFIDALPVAGVEGGTLARRMTGTRAAGNVRAKTGSIANVRALSGFLQTADGEPLVFSVLANAFTQPPATITSTVDLAMERLANFTRK